MPKVAILLAEGFEETEALTTYDVLRRGGVDAQLIDTTIPLAKPTSAQTQNFFQPAQKSRNPFARSAPEQAAEKPQNPFAKSAAQSNAPFAKPAAQTLEKSPITSAHGVQVLAHQSLDLGVLRFYDALVLPGGMPGAKNLGENPDVITLVRSFFFSGKLTAAICAAPAEVLKKAEVTKGKRLTAYPSYATAFPDAEYLAEDVVLDGNLLTSRGPATTFAFALKILEYFKIDTVAVKNGLLLS